MRMKNYWFLVMVIGLIFLMTGCFNSEVVEVGKGLLKIDLKIPQQSPNKATTQSFIDNIQLSMVKVNLHKGETVINKDFPIVQGSAQIVFDSLEIGNWTVDLKVIDSDGYDIYTGSASATITDGATAQVAVQLKLVPGDLQIIAMVPNDPAIARGQAVLCVPGGLNLMENLQLAGSTGTATFYQVMAMTWPLRVEFYNTDGQLLYSGDNQVNVYPGRTTTANVKFGTGGLEVVVSWETLPTEPTGLQATVKNSWVYLSWSANPEPNIDGYLVYRSTSATGSRKLMGDNLLHETTFVDNTGQEGQTYWYWVQAFNTERRSSELSAPVSVLVVKPLVSKVLFTMWDNVNYRICSVNTDGSDERYLTFGPMDGNRPVWSSDGSKIAFCDYAAHKGIYVMNADGSNIVQLTTSGSAPAWSPDGTRIAYNTPDGLMVMNADGTNQTKISNLSGGPVWSPDGSKIAFDDALNQEIVVINADGTNPRSMTNNSPALDFYPVWSPDGSKIAFTSDGGSQKILHVVNSDGSGLTPLVVSDQTLSTPSWSPDGTQIAYSNYDYVYLINPHGGTPVQLASCGGSLGSPKWTRDGAKVVFVRFSNATCNIFAINADGTGEAQLNRLIFPDTLGQKLSVY